MRTSSMHASQYYSSIVGCIIIASVVPLLTFNFLRPINGEENNFVVSLYDNEPQVVEFNARNFGQKVYKNYSAKPSHFIEFYASWCGHCQKYVPIWAKLASATKGWNKVVLVGAVNCALKQNELLCLSHNVTYYPQIKYFPRHAKTVNDGIIATASHGVVKMKSTLLEMILEDYAAAKYEDWPNFDYLPDVQDLSSLRNLSGLGHNPHIGLIFDDEGSSEDRGSIGAEVMLDLFSVDSISVRRVSMKNPLTLDLGVDTFPTFILLERRNNSIIYKSNFKKTVEDELSRLLVSNGHVITTVLLLTTSTMAPTTTTLSIEQTKRKFILTETDLLLTAKHSLLDAVTSGYLEISNPKLQHLLNFVNLLKEFFPPVSGPVQQTLRKFGVAFPQNLQRSRRAKNFFSDLHLFLNSSGERPIKRADWISKFNELENKHGKPFPSSEYIHCRGSKPVYRGYTCGLWTMFHTLTVNAFYERGFQPNFEPLTILKAIQGYVENFFGCTACASHFVDMVTRSFNMEHFVHNAADVVLYLWQAHNIVNNRLAREKTEDPTMPKVQFPPDFLCSYCRNATTGRWNENAVLHFLTRYYGSDIQPHKE